MVPLKDVNGINSEPMALINQCQLLETIVVQEIMTSILLKKSKEINERKEKKRKKKDSLRRNNVSSQQPYIKLWDVNLG